MVLANLAYRDRVLAARPDVLASLRRALAKDAHPHAREAAIGTLAKLGDTASLPVMEKLLTKARGDMAATLRHAIAKLAKRVARG